MRHPRCYACRDKEGGLVTNKRCLRDGQHFEKLLNRTGDQNPENSRPSEMRAPCRNDHHSEPQDIPSREEVGKAIDRLKNNKALGCDGISIELIKGGNGYIVSFLHELTCDKDAQGMGDWHHMPTA